MLEGFHANMSQFFMRKSMSASSCARSRLLPPSSSPSCAFFESLLGMNASVVIEVNSENWVAVDNP